MQNLLYVGKTKITIDGNTKALFLVKIKRSLMQNYALLQLVEKFLEKSYQIVIKSL